MSTEQIRESVENKKWYAGNVEKAGAGISAVLLGGAILFPETGKLLPSLAGSIAFLDLVMLSIKDMGNVIDRDISRMNSSDQSWIQ